MANQIMQLAEAENGQAYVRCRYDDGTRIANQAIWANLSAVPVLVWVTKPDGTAIIDRQTIPAGTAEQSRNLTGPNRFNVDTEPPAVNLAS